MLRPSTSFKTTLGLTVGALALVGSAVNAQTEDTVWHNRYHAVLAMAAYGDYETLCPQQTFTEASMRQNFPNTDLPAWEIIERFGPTEHGAEGFTVLIPEMDKVVLIFKGDYGLESSLPSNVTSFAGLGLGEDVCENCTVNEYALQGYVEARAATNNWAASRARYESTGLQYSITGHGLGGMHSLIASVDLGWAGVCRWSHNYGTPRTFNAAGAAFYDRMFMGEAGERGVANNDRFVEIIPASEDYAFTGTAFLYTGYNETTHMTMTACWDEPDSPDCAPRTPLDERSHYFYFVHAEQCGGRNRINETWLEDIYAEYSSEHYATATSAPWSAANATSTLAMPNATSTAADMSATATTTAASQAGIAGAAAGAPTAAAADIVGAGFATASRSKVVAVAAGGILGAVALACVA